MKIKLSNPADGADIFATFTPLGKEERDQKQNVINSEQIIFKTGTELICNEKQAEYILKQWGFIENLGTVDEELAPEVKKAIKEEVSRSETPKEEVSAVKDEDESPKEKDINVSDLHCEKCGKECKNKLGRMAHERHCKK